MTCSFDIAFHSTIMGLGTSHGYGYAAYELITAWQRLGHPVWWGAVEPEIGFNFVQPHFYERLNKINIGYTPWESTEVPEHWIPKMNEMQAIWTPSEACKQWFTEAGVQQDIKVVPHGINEAHWPLQRRTASAKEPFRFLHVGSNTPRKGALDAYTAFAESFADTDDVILVLKGKPKFEIKCSNVYVINEDLSQSELTKLYLKCHAMIYPSRGEGFGLIPFQAAATAMPTFVTDWSGPKDFMQHCWPIKVSALVDCDYEPHQGQWAQPSINDLINYMQDIVMQPDYYFKNAVQKAEQMRPKYSWDSIAKDTIDIMEQLF